MFDNEPVNPPYYPELLEAEGALPETLFESRQVKAEDVPAVFRAKAPLLEALRLSPFEAIAPEPSYWQQHSQELYELIMAVFSANPGFQPISYESFEVHYSTRYAASLCPHTSVLLRDRSSNRLAGLSFTQPDYQQLQQGAPPDGGVFTRDCSQLPHKRLLIRTVGVHPGFRRQGVMNLLGAYGMAHFTPYYEDAIFCLMRSDIPSLRFSDGLHEEKAQYAVYRLPVLPPPVPGIPKA